jgi:hypothetical protein
MNCTGWLIGGGSAPVLIGLLSRHVGMGLSIALSATAYLIAGALLLVGMTNFLANDLLRLGRHATVAAPSLAQNG